MRIPLKAFQLIGASTLLVGVAASAPAAETGSLRVGAARVDITPPVNPAYPPSGKYAHERLYVRAIVLDNGAARAALVGADLGGLNDEIWTPASKQIAAALNCPAENVILTATHSHSAGPAGPPVFPPRQETATTVASILDAVRQAKARLQPALVGFGTGFSYLNVNRDAISGETHLWTQAPNLDGPSDKTVAVVEFTTPAGEPIAAYVNYAMHPINGFLVGITSADVPGATSRYVEQQFGDTTVVIWAQGALGDQNPLYTRPATNALASLSGVKITGYQLVRESVEGPLREGKVPRGTLDPKVADTLERWMESQGQLLGEEVIRVMTNITRRAGNVRIWGAQKALTCPARRRTDTGREGSPGTYEDSAEPVNIRLGLLGIGTTALTTVNAELYSAIAQRVKKESPMADTVVVGLANGRADSGYIPDDAAFGRSTFQVLGSRLKPGCAEEGIVDGLTELIDQYVGQQGAEARGGQ